MNHELRWIIITATLVAMPCAFAQSTLGELLDAGAKPVPPEQFKTEVVQRTIIGLSPAGSQFELMYAASGIIQGTAAGNNQVVSQSGSGASSPINGEWRTDNLDRICTSLMVTYGAGTPVVLQPRCQYWFKLDGKRYFYADSDSDRSAKVFARTIK